MNKYKKIIFKLAPIPIIILGFALLCINLFLFQNDSKDTYYKEIILNKKLELFNIYNKTIDFFIKNYDIPDGSDEAVLIVYHINDPYLIDCVLKIDIFNGNPTIEVLLSKGQLIVNIMQYPYGVLIFGENGVPEKFIWHSEVYRNKRILLFRR